MHPLSGRLFSPNQKIQLRKAPIACPALPKNQVCLVDNSQRMTLAESPLSPYLVNVRISTEPLSKLFLSENEDNMATACDFLDSHNRQRNYFELASGAWLQLGPEGQKKLLANPYMETNASIICNYTSAKDLKETLTWLQTDPQPQCVFILKQLKGKIQRQARQVGKILARFSTPKQRLIFLEKDRAIEMLHPGSYTLNGLPDLNIQLICAAGSCFRLTGLRKSSAVQNVRKTIQPHYFLPKQVPHQHYFYERPRSATLDIELGQVILIRSHHTMIHLNTKPGS
jgi:hypothetical protein